MRKTLFFQEKVKELHTGLTVETIPVILKSTSNGGERAINDDMDDIKSREKCETLILDRKIESLSNLRDKWRETESNLKQLSEELKKYEIKIAQIEKDSELNESKSFDSNQATQWFSQLSQLEQSVVSLEVQLSKDEAIVQELEQHVDSATRLTTRAANLRGRYETLRNSFTLIIHSIVVMIIVYK